LQVRVEGEQLRHYPDTDTLEIDAVQLRSFAADGTVTRATAKRALTNGDASEVQLLGGAQVVSDSGPRGQPLQFDGEFLHAFLDAERLTSHLPVRLTMGRDEIRAGGLEYDHKTQQARFLGPVKGRFDAPSRR
jgi:lipopolysaccharide export system protein LptC